MRRRRRSAGRHPGEKSTSGVVTRAGHWQGEREREREGERGKKKKLDAGERGWGEIARRMKTRSGRPG